MIRKRRLAGGATFTIAVALAATASWSQDVIMRRPLPLHHAGPGGTGTPTPTDPGTGTPGTTPTSTPTPTPTPTPTSTVGDQCGSEGQTVHITTPQTVKYGANGTYATKDETSDFTCGNGEFGDPLPGVVKACYCSDATTTSVPSCSDGVRRMGQLVYDAAGSQIAMPTQLSQLGVTPPDFCGKARLAGDGDSLGRGGGNSYIFRMYVDDWPTCNRIEQQIAGHDAQYTSVDYSQPEGCGDSYGGLYWKRIDMAMAPGQSQYVRSQAASGAAAVRAAILAQDAPWRPNSYSEAGYTADWLNLGSSINVGQVGDHLFSQNYLWYQSVCSRINVDRTGSVYDDPNGVPPLTFANPEDCEQTYGQPIQILNLDSVLAPPLADRVQNVGRIVRGQASQSIELAGNYGTWGASQPDMGNELYNDQFFQWGLHYVYQVFVHDRAVCNEIGARTGTGLAGQVDYTKPEGCARAPYGDASYWREYEDVQVPAQVAYIRAQGQKVRNNMFTAAAMTVTAGASGGQSMQVAASNVDIRKIDYDKTPDMRSLGFGPNVIQIPNDGPLYFVAYLNSLADCSEINVEGGGPAYGNDGQLTERIGARPEGCGDAGYNTKMYYRLLSPCSDFSMSCVFPPDPPVGQPPVVQASQCTAAPIAASDCAARGYDKQVSFTRLNVSIATNSYYNCADHEDAGECCQVVTPSENGTSNDTGGGFEDITYYTNSTCTAPH